jgi:hypothetical protein
MRKFLKKSEDLPDGNLSGRKGRSPEKRSRQSAQESGAVGKVLDRVKEEKKRAEERPFAADGVGSGKNGVTHQVTQRGI